MRHRLRLHGRVDHDPLEILVRQRAGLVRHRQALLHQRHQRLLAEPLAPVRHRGAVERQPVAEAQLAAKILVIRVLQPARAQHLVRQVVHVLENEQARHQPRRQPGLSCSRLARRAEAPVEKAPVDLARQPHQRMAHVDDRLQRGQQQVLLTLVSRLRHASLLRKPPQNRITNRSKSESQIARKPRAKPAFLAKSITENQRKTVAPHQPPHSSRSTI